MNEGIGQKTQDQIGDGLLNIEFKDQGRKDYRCQHRHGIVDPPGKAGHCAKSSKDHSQDNNDQ